MKSLLKKLKPVEVKLKYALVGVLSYVLKRSVKKVGKPDFTRPLKVLFIRHERIGDNFIAFPVVDILKKRYPNWNISWLTSPRSFDLVSEDPRFSEVYLYSKNMIRDRKLIRRVRKQKYDIAVDLINSDSVSAVMLTHLLAPKAYKIGMGKARNAEYYHVNSAHPFHYSNRHILETTLDLVRYMGVEPAEADRFCPPYISDTKKRNVTEFLNGVKSGDDGWPLVGVNICSGEPTREWGADKFGRVIATLLDKYPAPRFIVIADPSSYDMGIKLAASFGDRVYIPPKPMDICTVAELISRLNLLITGDTSLLHFARSYRIPVVGLYLYHKLDVWFPYAQRSGMICSDSEKHLFNITVDEVLDKVYEIGEKYKVPGLGTCPTHT